MMLQMLEQIKKLVATPDSSGNTPDVEAKYNSGYGAEGKFGLNIINIPHTNGKIH